MSSEVEQLRAENEELSLALWALANGWDVRRRTFYGREGVEGWEWTAPGGRSWTEIGDWSEAPAMGPEMVEVMREAKAKA